MEYSGGTGLGTAMTIWMLVCPPRKDSILLDLVRVPLPVRGYLSVESCSKQAAYGKSML
jgi:hypothetical protein